MSVNPVCPRLFISYDVRNDRIPRTKTHLETRIDLIVERLPTRDRTLRDHDGAIIPIRVVEEHAMRVQGCPDRRVAQTVCSVNEQLVALRGGQRGWTGVVNTVRISLSRLRDRSAAGHTHGQEPLTPTTRLSNI
jgi:hypothetical protein